jgi:hypothetical protein
MANQNMVQEARKESAPKEAWWWGWWEKQIEKSINELIPIITEKIKKTIKAYLNFIKEENASDNVKLKIKDIENEISQIIVFIKKWIIKVEDFKDKNIEEFVISKII